MTLFPTWTLPDLVQNAQAPLLSAFCPDCGDLTYHRVSAVKSKPMSETLTGLWWCFRCDYLNLWHEFIPPLPSGFEISENGHIIPLVV